MSLLEAVALLGTRMGSKVSILDDGCWVWNGALCSTGYGWCAPQFNTKLAHRISYMLLHGKIPPGLELDHLCRKRSCVNPAHLEAVSRRTNVLRGAGNAAVNSKKTHCPKGHPYEGHNVMIQIIGSRKKRSCRQCQNEKTLARYHRNKSRG